MQTTESDRRQIALAQEYFRRVDAGRADLTDLMSEDVEFYFPKFGTGRGKGAFGKGHPDSASADSDSVHPGLR